MTTIRPNRSENTHLRVEVPDVTSDNGEAKVRLLVVDYRGGELTVSVWDERMDVKQCSVSVPMR